MVGDRNLTSVYPNISLQSFSDLIMSATYDTVGAQVYDRYQANDDL